MELDRQEVQRMTVLRKRDSRLENLLHSQIVSTTLLILMMALLLGLFGHFFPAR